MRVALTPEDLSAFEEDIAECFRRRKIRAPIHLSGGNESQLIRVFREHVDAEDWILCSWRSHLHCLLKGVPPVIVRAAIMEGKSIALCFPDYSILSSAIVGGTAPIAVGLAMALKRKGEARKVVCFLGDMTAETGIAYESIKYAANHRLPVKWIIEDNHLSTGTDTMLAWGAVTTLSDPSIVRYEYDNKWPHCGVFEWVSF